MKPTHMKSMTRIQLIRTDLNTTELQENYQKRNKNFFGRAEAQHPLPLIKNKKVEETFHIVLDPDPKRNSEKKTYAM